MNKYYNVKNFVCPVCWEDFLVDLSNPEDTLNGIITTLICKGIENITDEVKSPENIELMIDNIFSDETKNIKE